MKLSRTQVTNVSLLIGFGFLSAFLMHMTLGDLPDRVEVGLIANRDIRADNDYEIVDEVETEKLKEAAVAAVRGIFDWDDSKGRGKVLADRSVLEPWKEVGIEILRVLAPSDPPLLFKDFSGILSLEEARARVASPTRKDQVEPNLVFNEEATKARQDQVASEVLPVVIKVRRGESIIRAGDAFNSRNITIVQGILKQKAEIQRWPRISGAFVLVLLLIGVLFGYAHPVVRRARLSRRDLVFLGVLFLVTLLQTRLLLFLAQPVRSLLPIDIPLSALLAAIPVAAGAMVVRLVLPREMAYLFALVSAVLSGLVTNSLTLTLFYLIESVAGVVFVAQARSRTGLLKVGFWTGLVNIAALFSLNLLSLASLTGIWGTQAMLLRLLLAGFGGILCSMAVVILMPIFEAAFNYLTPMKLLEYGSLNHPLLREMIVRAPGTYHHSHMVGTLAESACEAIGADALFARVASYFHDIGKLKKASYFIENQSEGEDRHASLSPSMSALIISAHVKEGMDLAREYKLPQRIIDIIPQHQGTKLISYFYSRAKEREDRTVQTIQEKDYRYPGPRPQTREAGVILLADTVEAATRASRDRSATRIEEIVRNMINKNFIDGQLDECELTLKDLQTIAKSFVRILMGIYHQRIEYPVAPEEERLPTGPADAHDDKFTQARPITEDSFREPEEISPGRVPRIRSFRDRN